MKTKLKNTPEVRGIASLQRRELTPEERSAGFIGIIKGSIPFNADSQIMVRRDKDGRARQFVERIAPTAFSKSLAEDRDIVATAGHAEDPLSAFAIIGENLTITTDDRAMEWEAKVPDTNAGKDLMRLVDMGIIKGTSFEFLPRDNGQTWERRGTDMDVRTITDARLFEVNPVKWPAYLGTSLTVEMRGRYSNENKYIDYWDKTVTPDTAYAQGILGSLVGWMTNSLEFLRDNPESPMSGFARAYVASTAEQITQLVDYLKTDGDTARIEEAQKAMRSAEDFLKESAKSPISNAHRQRALELIDKTAIA